MSSFPFLRFSLWHIIHNEFFSFLNMNLSCRTVAVRKKYCWQTGDICQQKFFRRATVLQLHEPLRLSYIMNSNLVKCRFFCIVSYIFWHIANNFITMHIKVLAKFYYCLKMYTTFHRLKHFKVTWVTQVTYCYGLASVVVRRPSCVNIFSSETTGPILTKFGM